MLLRNSGTKLNQQHPAFVLKPYLKGILNGDKPLIKTKKKIHDAYNKQPQLNKNRHHEGVM